MKTKEYTRRQFAGMASATAFAVASFSLLDLWSLGKVEESVPEGGGHICVVWGQQGSGMTLFSVAMAFAAWKKYGRKVISNTPLKFDYELLDTEKFLEYTDSTILIDDAWTLADRSSSGGGARTLLKALKDAREKNNNYLIVCPHAEEMLDRRILRSVTHKIRTRYNYETKTVHFQTTDLAVGGITRGKIYGPDFFDKYDTFSMVRPLIMDEAYHYMDGRSGAMNRLFGFLYGRKSSYE